MAKAIPGKDGHCWGSHLASANWCWFPDRASLEQGIRLAGAIDCLAVELSAVQRAAPETRQQLAKLPQEVSHQGWQPLGRWWWAGGKSVTSIPKNCYSRYPTYRGSLLPTPLQQQEEGIPATMRGWIGTWSCKWRGLAWQSLLGIVLAGGIGGVRGAGALELDAQLGRSQRVSPTRDCPACDLTGAQLPGVDLQGANLKEAILKQANLQAADLSRSILNLSDLSQANLSHSRQAGAFLWEANLSQANLQQADLTGAHLQVADLSEANLRWATLRQTDLTGAKLQKADLRGADLRGAFLGEADLRGALYDSHTQLDPSLNPRDLGMVFLP